MGHVVGEERGLLGSLFGVAAQESGLLVLEAVSAGGPAVRGEDSGLGVPVAVEVSGGQVEQRLRRAFGQLDGGAGLVPGTVQREQTAHVVQTRHRLLVPRRLQGLPSLLPALAALQLGALLPGLGASLLARLGDFLLKQVGRRKCVYALGLLVQAVQSGQALRALEGHRVLHTGHRGGRFSLALLLARKPHLVRSFDFDLQVFRGGFEVGDLRLRVFKGLVPGFDVLDDGLLDDEILEGVEASFGGVPSPAEGRVGSGLVEGLEEGRPFLGGGELVGGCLLVAGPVEEQRLGPAAGAEQVEQGLVRSLDSQGLLGGRLHVQTDLGRLVRAHWLLQGALRRKGRKVRGGAPLVALTRRLCLLGLRGRLGL